MGLGDYAMYLLTGIGFIGFLILTTFSIYVWYKEAYTEEGYLTDKDKAHWNP
ncbi:MAG: hypothetical protein R8M46_06550 [Ghiorsea sp.]